MSEKINIKSVLLCRASLTANGEVIDADSDREDAAIILGVHLKTGQFAPLTTATVEWRGLHRNIHCACRRVELAGVIWTGGGSVGGRGRTGALNSRLAPQWSRCILGIPAAGLREADAASSAPAAARFRRTKTPQRATAFQCEALSGKSHRCTLEASGFQTGNRFSGARPFREVASARIGGIV